MRLITAADLVWIAVAGLTRADPARTGFSHDEIRRKVYELEPDRGLKDVTIRTHIAIHCVANKRPDPLRHRKLYLNDDGTYRLFRPGDACHPDRASGKLAPDVNEIPAKYRALVEWFHHSLETETQSASDQDPLLALRGLGKELWRDLGGGDKFIRELRANWYGSESKHPVHRSSRRRAG